MNSSAKNWSWLVVLTRLLVGIGAGVIFACAFWTGDLILTGQSVTKALRGEIEDALGGLAGLITLSVMTGGFVGLLHGFAVIQRTYKDQVPIQREN